VIDDIREVERAVIGHTMLYYDGAKACTLPEHDFCDDQCRAIYAHFLTSEHLGDYRRRISNAKLMAAACKMMDCVAAPSLLEYNISRIKSAAQARRIKWELAELDNEADEDLLSKLAELVAKEQVNVSAGIDDIPLAQAEEAIRELRRKDTRDRLLTGIPSLDRITGGLRPGFISILGAYPSAGKTAFALGVALEAVRSVRNVLFITLEMSATQIWERLVATELRLSYDAINNKRLSDPELGKAEKLIRTCGTIGNPYIADQVGLIERQAELIYKLKPDLVIVDFLQYCRTGKRFSSVNDQLEWMVSEYKRIARLPANPCHIMVLSQLSRSDSKRGDMFSLRGSGGIEAGGDYIFLLDRPMLRDRKEPAERVHLKVAKNKTGRAGMELDLYFDGDYQQFRELAKDERWAKEDENKKPW